MQPKDTISNYFLTLGFVLLIILGVVALMFVSRFALEDVSPLGGHVIETKNLLQDASEVKKSALEQTVGNTTVLPETSVQLRENIKIIDASYYNVNEHKGIMTFIVNGSVFRNDDKYYVGLKQSDELQKGDEVVYFYGNKTLVGQVLLHNPDGTITLRNEKTNILDRPQRVNILGYYLLTYSQ